MFDRSNIVACCPTTDERGLCASAGSPLSDLTRSSRAAGASARLDRAARCAPRDACRMGGGAAGRSPRRGLRSSYRASTGASWAGVLAHQRAKLPLALAQACAGHHFNHLHPRRRSSHGLRAGGSAASRLPSEASARTSHDRTPSGKFLIRARRRPHTSSQETRNRAKEAVDGAFMGGTASSVYGCCTRLLRAPRTIVDSQFGAQQRERRYRG